MTSTKKIPKIVGVFLALSILTLSFLVITHYVRAASLTVNSLLDTSDATPGDGVCDDGSGNCTLRAAMDEANAF